MIDREQLAREVAERYKGWHVFKNTEHGAVKLEIDGLIPIFIDYQGSNADKLFSALLDLAEENQRLKAERDDYNHVLRIVQAERDSLKAELTRLRELNHGHMGSILFLNEELTQLRSRIAELESALRRYGVHKGRCDAFDCECGLTDALKASSPASAPEKEGER